MPARIRDRRNGPAAARPEAHKTSEVPGPLWSAVRSVCRTHTAPPQIATPIPASEVPAVGGSRQLPVQED